MYVVRAFAKLCRGWKFGVIGKLLSGKEVQSSRPREKPGKALLTPLIPTQSSPTHSSSTAPHHHLLNLFQPSSSASPATSSPVLLRRTFLNPTMPRGFQKLLRQSTPQPCFRLLGPVPKNFTTLERPTLF